MPKLSIITINYNNRVGIQKTIESVVNQTYTNLEYIVIDGGSKDGSKEAIQQYSDKINYWVSEADNGIYNAMNKGIQKAQGEYLLFLNSGDILQNYSILEKVSSELHQQDILYANLEMVQENGNSFLVKPLKTLSFEYLYNEFLPHPSTFIKKELFEKHGLYDESLKIISDWKFFLLAICKWNATYKHIDVVLSKFYMDGISAAEDSRMIILNEKKQVLEDEFNTFIPMIEGFEKFQMAKGYYNNSKRIKFLSYIGFLPKIEL